MDSKNKYKDWLEAVEKDHNALLDVPVELWTDELCLKAVKTDYSILYYIPKKNLTKEICIEAYKKSPGGCIRYIPKDLREIYIKHIKDISLNKK